jgi:hypothetical protein
MFNIPCPEEREHPDRITEVIKLSTFFQDNHVCVADCNFQVGRPKLNPFSLFLMNLEHETNFIKEHFITFIHIFDLDSQRNFSSKLLRGTALLNRYKSSQLFF